MKNYQAKTLEEIIEQAAEDYGCDTSSLMYNVLEEKDGILGIGKSITAEVFTMDDVKEFLFDYMGDFFTGIDLDLECAIEEKDNAFIVNLNADNNAVLIGKTFCASLSKLSVNSFSIIGNLNSMDFSH